MNLVLGRNLFVAIATLFAVTALADGESRPTTAAEQAYSLKVRKTLRASLAGIEKLDWTLVDSQAMQADESTAPDQQKHPYPLSYEMQLAIKPDSARMQRLTKAFDSIMAQVQTGKMPPDYVERVNAIQKEQGPSIVFLTNAGAGSFILFDEKGAKWQKITVPGAKHAVRATKVQSLSGGDVDSSFDATFLYLGSFGEPKKTEDATVGADGGLKTSANYLTVQNVFIRVEAPHAVADELIKAIDLQSLNALMKASP